MSELKCSQQMAGMISVMKQMMARGMSANFTGDIDPIRLRSVIEVAQSNMPVESGVTIIQKKVGEMDAELLVPENSRDNAVIIYFHGGGLICGSAKSSRGYASMLAGESNIPVYTLSYRLAPENKCPAAIDDCILLYKEVLQENSDKAVFFIGESGGAYLSLTTALKAKKLGIKLPAGVILYSPPIEFCGIMDRNHKNNKDFTVSPDGLDSLGRMYYVDESQYVDPIYTPYYADFNGFVPTYIVWDESESLAVDSEYLKNKMISCGVDVTYDSYPDCFHAFPTTGRGTPESLEVLHKTVAFFDKHTKR